MKEQIVEAGGRDLLELLRDLLRPNPNPEKIDIYWSDTAEGDAPDFGLLIAIKAAAQDGLSEDGISNIGLEAGDGSPDSLSNMVFYIPGGLGIIIATRRHERHEKEIAEWLEEELDLDDETVECHKNRHKYNARRSRMAPTPTPDLAN